MKWWSWIISRTKLQRNLQNCNAKDVANLSLQVSNVHSWALYGHITGRSAQIVSLLCLLSLLLLRYPTCCSDSHAQNFKCDSITLNVHQGTRAMFCFHTYHVAQPRSVEEPMIALDAHRKHSMQPSGIVSVPARARHKTMTTKKTCPTQNEHNKQNRLAPFIGSHSTMSLWDMPRNTFLYNSNFQRCSSSHCLGTISQHLQLSRVHRCHFSLIFHTYW